jgi:hypothetical protein
MITPEAVLDGAVRATGLDDFGSLHFMPFLDAWCADLAGSHLAESGSQALLRQASRNLEVRLRVQDTLSRFPEIDAVPIPPVVRIMGFPRSGTTMLHNLLARLPGHRALLRWELVDPVPPPEAATYASDPRIAKVQRPLEALRGTELERMHWVRADEPEECTWGFLDLSGLMGRGCMAAMPSWADLVVDHSGPHRVTYAEYRRLIKLLLWRNPMPPESVLVLKCPMDVGELATFLDAFPEAKVLLCHRDPFRTVTSGCRMQDVVCGSFLARPEARIDGATEQAIRMTAMFADAMVDAIALGDRVASVRYSDLMTRPADVVVGACRALGIPADPHATAQAARDYATAQHSQRVMPPAAYPDYGLSADAIRRHPAFARYIETFDVPAEDQRIVEPAQAP